ncbi:MAG: hypothetical protein NTW21_23155 [Verrucomicrobia bacterium]|nr:hypothetical protein [Verrucomicrobiota bacterium]
MNDSQPQAEAVRLRILRAMSPARRLALAAGWTASLRTLIRARVAEESGAATALRQRRLFAERWLGPELALKVYGPLDSHG